MGHPVEEAGFPFRHYLIHFDIVMFLIGLKVDPNTTDANGNGLLGLAALGGHDAVVQIPLEKGGAVSECKKRRWRITAPSGRSRREH